jgi:hypothetical protein
MSSHVADALFLGRIFAGFVLVTALAGIAMAYALLSLARLPTIIG